MKKILLAAAATVSSLSTPASATAESPTVQSTVSETQQIVSSLSAPVSPETSNPRWGSSLVQDIRSCIISNPDYQVAGMVTKHLGNWDSLHTDSLRAEVISLDSNNWLLNIRNGSDLTHSHITLLESTLSDHCSWRNYKPNGEDLVAIN